MTLLFEFLIWLTEAATWAMILLTAALDIAILALILRRRARKKK